VAYCARHKPTGGTWHDASRLRAPSHSLRIRRAPIHSTLLPINVAWTAVIMTPANYSCVTLSALVIHIMYFFHYDPRPACRGSTSLYVPPLNYKREGTQRYKGQTQSHAHTYLIQLTPSGGRVLRSSGLNHYNPLCPLVFSPNSPNRQPLRPPPHLRIRAGAFRHPADGFPHRHLARQVGGFGFRFFACFSCSTRWFRSSSTATCLPRTFGWKKGQRLLCHGALTALHLVLLLCTLHSSTRSCRHPGLRRGLLMVGRCLQPGSCCATHQVPRPHRWP
jgi:hypothetical protein